MIRTLCALVLSLVLVCTSSSLVVGPWTEERSVSLSWEWTLPDLLVLSIGPLDPPENITVANSDQVLLATGLPAWASGPHGTGPHVFVTSLGPAAVSITPQGDAVLRLVNASGIVPFETGAALGWRQTLRMPYFPQLRSLSQDLAVTIIPPVVDQNSNAIPVHIVAEPCGRVTMALWTTSWGWPALDFATHVLHFGTLLPEAYRPLTRVRSSVIVNLPAWSALCSLVIEPCGAVRIECEESMTSPVTFAGDQTVSWNL